MPALPLKVIGGIALQLPDQHWLAFRRLAHTGLFAKLLGRTDTGTHAAHDVLAQDRLGRRIRRAGRDLANEQRDVDVRGTGCDTGRVMAEIAAVRRDQRLVRIQRRMQVREPGGVVLRFQPAGSDSSLKNLLRHAALSCCDDHWENASTVSFFYQLVKLFQPHEISCARACRSIRGHRKCLIFTKLISISEVRREELSAPLPLAMERSSYDRAKLPHDAGRSKTGDTGHGYRHRKMVQHD